MAFTTRAEVSLRLDQSGLRLQVSALKRTERSELSKKKDLECSVRLDKHRLACFAGALRMLVFPVKPEIKINQARIFRVAAISSLSYSRSGTAKNPWVTLFVSV